MADSFRERVQDHHGKELDSEQTDVVLEKWLRTDLSTSRRQREQETERQRPERDWDQLRLLKPQSQPQSGMPPPPHLLELAKQCYQLRTKD